MHVIQSGKPVELEPKSTYESGRVWSANLRYCIAGRTQIRRNERISGCVIYAIAPLVPATLKSMLLRILRAPSEPSEASIEMHLSRRRLTVTPEHVVLVEKQARGLFQNTGLLANGMPNVWLVETRERGVEAIVRRSYDGEWIEEASPLFGNWEFSRSCRLMLPRLPAEAEFPKFN